MSTSGCGFYALSRIEWEGNEKHPVLVSEMELLPLFRPVKAETGITGRVIGFPSIYGAFARLLSPFRFLCPALAGCALGHLLDIAPDGLQGQIAVFLLPVVVIGHVLSGG